MSERCKVAVIGAGNMAREHLHAFRDVPGVSLEGIFSRTRSRADVLAKEFGVAGVYDSIAELYAATRADLVVITVFELAMKEVAIECFKYPWTVLLEKPAGHTFALAEQIAATATREKRNAFVAFNRRFHASTRQALARLSEVPGARYVRVQDQQDLEVARSIGQPEEVVQNWMYANSIHLVDYFLAFGRGKVREVENLTHWNPHRPGVVLAQIKFDSGDLGFYEGIWDGPGPWAVSISTPKERIELRPLEQLNFQIRGERKINSVDSGLVDTAFKPGFRLQAEQVVNAALGKPNDCVRLVDGLESMRLVQRIFQVG